MASNTFTTTVHRLSSPLTEDACAYEIGLPSAQNALVFIGGLGDGPHTLGYPHTLAKELEAHPELSYSVFEFRMRSSFWGWGFSQLSNDVMEMSSMVEYLRSINKKKIVFMGHSTGCQDCMEYSSPKYSSASYAPPEYPKLEPVEGFILQGPVSDREALRFLEKDQQRLEQGLQYAKDAVANGRGDDCMPHRLVPITFYPTPISAARWYSLVAADGEDNYFSSDLPDDVARPFWERINKPVLILPSGKDEWVDPSIDQEALVKRWKSMCRPGIASDLSGCIPGASHQVLETEAMTWLILTVVEFLRGI